MGTYKNGLNGSVSGKVGAVVGSNWRSIEYFRSLLKKSSKEPTVDQITQRAKFALAPFYLRPIKDVLNIGFGDKNLNKITGYNAAVKLFITQAVIGAYPDYIIDFSKVIMSKGSLSPIVNLAVGLEDDTLTFTWKKLLNKFSAFIDDSLIFIVLDSTKMMYLVFDDIVRDDEQYTVDMGGDYSGDTMHIWAFAVKRGDAAVSNSQYVGALTMP
ncbi:DUF6266 family protein [Pedobacter frigidisoli]|uniref:DUF6266 family protein n=1 Tax=Pedobacter frigidisoli TaxID=2530455 RepID=UPI00292D3027|nr:DUF6266 family protein [Pedobacter frigidisoli]